MYDTQNILKRFCINTLLQRTGFHLELRFISSFDQVKRSLISTYEINDFPISLRFQATGFKQDSKSQRRCIFQSDKITMAVRVEF